MNKKLTFGNKIKKKKTFNHSAVAGNRQEKVIEEEKREDIKVTNIVK